MRDALYVFEGKRSTVNELSQVLDRATPETFRYLLQRDELIEPADEELSADFRRLGLHLNDLEQDVKVDVRGQIIVAEPVESGLIWWCDERQCRTSRWWIESSYAILSFHRTGEFPPDSFL